MTQKIILGLSLLQMCCAHPNLFSKNSEKINEVLKNPISIPPSWLTNQVTEVEVEKFCSENSLTQIKHPSSPGFMDHLSAIKKQFQNGDEYWYWSSLDQKPPLPIGYVYACGYGLRRGPNVIYIFEIERSVVTTHYKPEDHAFIE